MVAAVRRRSPQVKKSVGNFVGIKIFHIEF
jgi:hypothetical protein